MVSWSVGIAKWQEARGEGNISHRLQVLLDLRVESATLESDDLGRRLGIVGDGRSALGAEKSPDSFTRAACALPLLNGAVYGQLVLGNNADEGYIPSEKKN